MSFLAPTSKCQVLKPLRKVGLAEFLETLGGPYSFAGERRWLKIVCAMGSSRPMLSYHVDFSIGKI
jgi:hypothetical protein